MSKSDPIPKGTVYLTDKPNVMTKKFKSAVTDSEMSVHYADVKDGINNLMTFIRQLPAKPLMQSKANLRAGATAISKRQ